MGQKGQLNENGKRIEEQVKKKGRIIMMSFRTFALTIMGTCTISMFSMQDYLNRIVQAAKTGDLATIRSLDPDRTNEAITTGDELGLTPLYIAARNGHLAIVEFYVKKLERHRKDINPVITAGQELGWTPLHCAAFHGRRAIVSYYVKKLENQDKNINPAIANGKILGLTPLYIAARNGHLAIVEFYVNKFESQDKDINPVITNGESLGWTQLHIAARNGHLAIVEFYVNKFESQDKDDINPAMTNGESLGATPLFAAASLGRLEIVDYYVKKLESLGKDINPALTAGDDLGVTPLTIAADRGNLATVVYYVKKLESQGKDINPALTAGQNLGVTPLNAAAQAGKLDIVKTLIYRGVPLAVKNNKGQTAEDVAREHNRQDVADYLAKTAPLTQQLLKECSRTKSLITELAESYQKLFKSQNEAGTIRYLTEAIDTNWDQVKKSLHQIKKLIRKGAEVNVQGKKGYSPLHCLIGYYNPEGPTRLDEEARTLIDSGSANIDAVADNGDTALSLAAQYGNSRIFKYLLKKGANPMIGKNPFLVAIQHNQMHIVRFLPGHEERTASYGSTR